MVLACRIPGHTPKCYVCKSEFNTAQMVYIGVIEGEFKPVCGECGDFK